MVESHSVEIQEERKTNNELDSLREFSSEAELVEQITRQPGWAIIERDLCAYKEQISKNIVYLDSGSKEYKEARILYIAADKVTSLFNDYAENKKRALELLNKIDNPQENITLDVDNGI